MRQPTQYVTTTLAPQMSDAQWAASTSGAAQPAQITARPPLMLRIRAPWAEVRCCNAHWRKPPTPSPHPRKVQGPAQHGPQPTHLHPLLLASIAQQQNPNRLGSTRSTRPCQPAPAQVAGNTCSTTAAQQMQQQAQHDRKKAVHMQQKCCTPFRTREAATAQHDRKKAVQAQQQQKTAAAGAQVLFRIV